MSREQIKTMQRILRRFGYTGHIDGIYGPIMERALYNYIQAQGHEGATVEGTKISMGPLAPRTKGQRYDLGILSKASSETKIYVPQGPPVPRTKAQRHDLGIVTKGPRHDLGVQSKTSSETKIYVPQGPLVPRE